MKRNMKYYTTGNLQFAVCRYEVLYDELNAPETNAEKKEQLREEIRSLLTNTKSAFRFVALSGGRLATESTLERPQNLQTPINAPPLKNTPGKFWNASKAKSRTRLTKRQKKTLRSSASDS